MSDGWVSPTAQFHKGKANQGHDSQSGELVTVRLLSQNFGKHFCALGARRFARASRGVASRMAWLVTQNDRHEPLLQSPARINTRARRRELPGGAADEKTCR